MKKSHISHEVPFALDLPAPSASLPLPLGISQALFIFTVVSSGQGTTLYLTHSRKSSAHRGSKEKGWNSHLLERAFGLLSHDAPFSPTNVSKGWCAENCPVTKPTGKEQVTINGSPIYRPCFAVWVYAGDAMPT